MAKFSRGFQIRTKTTSTALSACFEALSTHNNPGQIFCSVRGRQDRAARCPQDAALGFAGEASAVVSTAASESLANT